MKDVVTAVVDPKSALDRIVAGEGIELVDSATGWRLLLDMLDGDPSQFDAGLVVFARGADAGIPFVLIAQPQPREPETIDVSDPYWEVGEVD